MVIEEENIIWIRSLTGVVEAVHHCPENIKPLGIISPQEGYAIYHGNRDASWLGDLLDKSGGIVTYAHEIISSV
jgi:hypothetical protein